MKKEIIQPIQPSEADILVSRINDQLRRVEIQFAGYLHCREKYRMTNRGDMTVKRLMEIIKTDDDVKMFIDYNFYLGAYSEVIGIYQFLNEIYSRAK